MGCVPNYTAAQFRVVLRPSRYYAIGLVCLLLLEVLALATMQSNVSALIIVLPWLAWHGLTQQGWLGSLRLPRCLDIHRGKCVLVYHDGRIVLASICASSVAWPWLIVLSVRDEALRHHYLIVWPDSASPLARCQLRVYLRWYHQRQLTNNAPKTKN